MARSGDSYRAVRRNLMFGRKPVGNTKPKERAEIFAMVSRTLAVGARQRKEQAQRQRAVADAIGTSVLDK